MVTDADKKIAVYLSVMDWKLVMACLVWHTNNREESCNVLWIAGKNRAVHIAGEIHGKLPKPPATASAEQK